MLQGFVDQRNQAGLIRSKNLSVFLASLLQSAHRQGMLTAATTTVECTKFYCASGNHSEEELHASTCTFLHLQALQPSTVPPLLFSVD